MLLQVWDLRGVITFNSLMIHVLMSACLYLSITLLGFLDGPHGQTQPSIYLLCRNMRAIARNLGAAVLSAQRGTSQGAIHFKDKCTARRT